MITVSILDDHALVIDGVKAMLANDAQIKVVHTHLTMHSLQEKLEEANILPNILLLDINLTDADGIDACKLLHKSYPNIAIIALTNFNETIFVKNMMKNGAKGFLLKNVSNQEMLQAIHTVFSGNIYIQEIIQKQLVSEQLGQSASNSYIPKLTRREKEILMLIVQEYTTAEIAEKLFIGASTVETHRLNLLQKFEVKNVAGLVREALKKGVI